jgi:uncharacterized protein with von Willebrand factor type A (vWA) domain
MTSPLSAGLDVTGRLALDRHCVFRDAYDEAAFDSFLEASSRLKACSRRGEARLRAFPALLSDVFCLLFKLRPTLVDRSLVRPAFLVNRYLIARLAAQSQVNGLRAETTLCEEAAAAGTVAVAERLLGELAANDFAEENLLFELEESIDTGGVARERPMPVRRKAAAGREARSSGGSGEVDGGALAYDLQQRLEMAEALKSFRGFERLLTLTRALAERLADNDPTGAQPTEVYDIGLGNELARLLPCELLALRNPRRKKDFLRRLLARQLLTYQITGRESSGPLVLLVDVSHSMAGEKELAAKALAIALAEVAAARGQRVHAMLFGSRTAPLWQVDFAGRRPQRQQILALAETFFGGGTDFERPISAAVELIAKHKQGAGQIVLISDGLCDVGEVWLSRVRALRMRHPFRILSVLLDGGPYSDAAPASFSDRIIRWSELLDPQQELAKT